MEEKVVVKDCLDYEKETVKKAIAQSLKSLGGLDKILGDSKRILVKPNLLRPSNIEKSVTTHPIVVEVIAEMCVSLGCSVVIADSPGGPYNKTLMNMCYSKTGYNYLDDIDSVELNQDMSSKFKEFHNGAHLKGFELITPYHEVDAVINVPKLKTHCLTYLTGAVKNNFGLIPGLQKTGFHARFPNPREFGEMLVDLCECAKPTINIMDAVVAMEGDGPAAGKPKKVGYMLTSTNPYALDQVAMQIAGLKPEKCVTHLEALKRDLLPLEEIKVEGNIPKIEAFEEPSTKKGPLALIPPAILKFMGNHITKYPHPNKTCIGCGKCAEICAKDAIIIKEKQAKVNLGKCIRCYCCHEICPVDAIDLKKPMIAKIFSRKKNK